MTEILKVVVFIMGTVHLFQGASDTNIAFSITWTVFDVAVFVKLLWFSIERYGKNVYFKAHMWCDLLYTVTIGVGYGTAVKFTSDPSKFGPVFLTQSIIWGILGLVIIYKNCSIHKECPDCMSIKVLVVWLGVGISKIMYCVDLGYHLGYTATFCVSMYLYYTITTCTVMATFIAYEGGSN